MTVPPGVVFTIKAFAFKSGYSDSGMASGYFDNQNGGSNLPAPKDDGEKTGQSEQQMSREELPSEVVKQSGRARAKQRETAISLSGLQPNLWNNAGLREEPGLSMSWWEQEQPGGGQSGTQQTTSGSRTVIYTLDLMGNRTNVRENGVDKSYVPNMLNQYSSAEGMGVTNGPSHEISDYSGTSYQYIGDSYLAKATAGASDYTLYYDALGRCVKRTSVINGGAAVTNYYLFEGEHWVVEYNQAGTIQGNILYGRGIDEIIARYNGSVPAGQEGQWYFPDRNGNISVVTNGGNTVRESYRYDAFGLPSVYDGGNNPLPSGTAIANKFLFTGREWNREFGFYEYRARAYNPTIGRFMSEDPKGFDAGDYNLYRYVENDPLDRTDPMGLDYGGPRSYSSNSGYEMDKLLHTVASATNFSVGYVSKGDNKIDTHSFHYAPAKDRSGKPMIVDNGNSKDYSYQILDPFMSPVQHAGYGNRETLVGKTEVLSGTLPDAVQRTSETTSVSANSKGIFTDRVGLGKGTMLNPNTSFTVRQTFSNRLYRDNHFYAPVTTQFVHIISVAEGRVVQIQSIPVEP